MHAAALTVAVCNLLGGLLCVALALPLVRGKVKPNLLYGGRTPKTLASDEAWYRVNAASGRWLLWLGVATAASGVLGWLLRSSVPGAWLVAGLTVCASCPCFAWFRC